MTDQDNFLVAQQLLGRTISPSAAQTSRRLCLDTYGPAPALRGESVQRDIPYGPDARHRMDVYRPCRPARGLVLFVHGGGYTSGDKNLDGGLYHGLTAHWLNQQDLIAVVMNYRLAPDHTWPAAAEDLLAAHRTLRQRAVLTPLERTLPLLWWGHSAGASHVADALARAHKDHPHSAVLMSGAYDPRQEPGRPGQRDYYGEAPALLADRASVETLAALNLRLCLIHAEFDPDFFLRQKNRLLDRRRENSMEDTVLVAKGFNHFTQLYHLGLHESSLDKRLKQFINQSLEK